MLIKETCSFDVLSNFQLIKNLSGKFRRQFGKTSLVSQENFKISDEFDLDMLIFIYYPFPKFCEI